MLGPALLNLLDNGEADDALLAQIQQAFTLETPNALERATGLYVWRRTWETRFGASRRGGDRKSVSFREQDQSAKISFWSVAAKATALDERSIQLDVQLCETLGPAYIRRFWTSPINDNAAALRTVAKLDERGRDRLASIWQDNPKLTFSAAMVAAKLRATDDADETAFQRLLDAWSRGGAKARRRFLIEVGVEPAAAEAAVIASRKRGAQ